MHYFDADGARVDLRDALPKGGTGVVYLIVLVGELHHMAIHVEQVVDTSGVVRVGERVDRAPNAHTAGAVDYQIVVSLVRGRKAVARLDPVGLPVQNQCSGRDLEHECVWWCTRRGLQLNSWSWRRREAVFVHVDDDLEGAQHQRWCLCKVAVSERRTCELRARLGIGGFDLDHLISALGKGQGYLAQSVCGRSDAGRLDAHSRAGDWLWLRCPASLPWMSC